MDLPTYTNIWRIEKRLYKLYDFRLPMPLPISWIAVFCGITVPYVVALAAIGVPFDHTLLWLYVLPPGVLTWLTTRPVLENKRLPELLVSQLRYLGEPRTWCRLVPLSEKNDIRVYARVWHRPAGAAAPATDGAAAMAVATTGRARAAGTVVAPGLAARIRPAGRPATEGAGPARGTQRTWRDGRGRQDLPLRAASAGPPSWPYAEMGTRSGQAPARARGTSAPARAGAGPAAPGLAGPGPAAPGLPLAAGLAGPGPAAPGLPPAPAPGLTGPGRAAPARAGWMEPAAGSSPGSLPADRLPAIPGQVLRGPATTAPGSGGSQAGRPVVPGGPPAARAASRSGGRSGPATGPLPIAPPIEVSHETQENHGPAGVPLWGRPARRNGPGAPASGPVTGARPPRALPPPAPGQQRGVSGPPRNDTSPQVSPGGPRQSPQARLARSLPEARSLPAEARSLPAEARSLPAEARSLPAEARSLPAEARSLQPGIPRHPPGARGSPLRAQRHPERPQRHPRRPRHRPPRPQSPRTPMPQSAPPRRPRPCPRSQPRLRLVPRSRPRPAEPAGRSRRSSAP